MEDEDKVTEAKAELRGKDAELRDESGETPDKNGVALFFTITVFEDGKYGLETNMGSAWKAYCCEVAAAIRKEWFGG